VGSRTNPHPLDLEFKFLQLTHKFIMHAKLVIEFVYRLLHLTYT